MPITSFSGPSQTWWQFPLVRHKTTARKTHQNSHNEANVITNEQQVETLKKQCNHCQLQNKGLLALHFKRSSTQQAWPTNLWTSVPIGVPIEVATILMYHVHWRHKTFFLFRLNVHLEIQVSNSFHPLYRSGNFEMEGWQLPWWRCKPSFIWKHFLQAAHPKSWVCFSGGCVGIFHGRIPVHRHQRCMTPLRCALWILSDTLQAQGTWAVCTLLRPFRLLFKRKHTGQCTWRAVPPACTLAG